ncbi:hypothetical protein HID58_043003, partial [Brassica napus]
KEGGGNNLDYVTMMQSEHNEHLSATLVKIELGTPTEPLQSQVIVLHRSRENNTSTDNSALHTTSNKRRWFRIRVRLMQPLETPTEGGIATLRAPPPNGESTTGTDTTRGTQENHSDNESDSYIDGEMQEAAA